MNAKITIALLSLALLAACGGPRPAALQGDVCHRIATEGHAPYPWPDILRSPVAMLQAATPAGAIDLLLPAEHNALRDRLARLYAGRARSREPVRILSVSAGGSWGAFSLGFLDGWGHNERDRRPVFDIVTGVSTGSMIAPIVFLDQPADNTCKASDACPTDLARLREKYRNLTDGQVLDKRSVLSLLSSSSLYDTAPLRREVEAIVTADLVVRIANERTAKGRSLIVMAVNLDSGMPTPFDLTDIAADVTKPADWRRRRIIDIIMASAAIPIAFPPVFIDGDMYVDGGTRKHAFILGNLVAAISGRPMGMPQAGLQRYVAAPAGPPIDLSIVVSGDMKVMPDCTGKQHLDLVRIVKRTATVSTDQLLRDSVELLLLNIGQSGANRARFIDASSLVSYPTPRPVAPTENLCPLPTDDDQLFNPRFQTCLDQRGYMLGQRDAIPWRTSPRITRKPVP